MHAVIQDSKKYCRIPTFILRIVSHDWFCQLEGFFFGFSFLTRDRSSKRAICTRMFRFFWGSVSLVYAARAFKEVVYLSTLFTTKFLGGQKEPSPISRGPHAYQYTVLENSCQKIYVFILYFLIYHFALSLIRHKLHLRPHFYSILSHFWWFFFKFEHIRLSPMRWVGFFFWQKIVWK